MASYRDLVGALESLLRAAAPKLGVDSTLVSHCARIVAEAKAGKTAETAWTPFEAATPHAPHPDLIRKGAALTGQSEDDVRLLIEQEMNANRLFVNSRYQVAVREAGPAFRHLSIKRIDQTQARSWRDLQRIKNDLLGPECEAVELFPAESRLVDTANQYHLWGSTEPSFQFPFSLSDTRLVAEDIGVGEGQTPIGEG
jgi:hypothetical protein